MTTRGSRGIKVDRSRYWRWGSVVIETPIRPRLSVEFKRNGRMLGLTVSLGGFVCSPAIYRSWDEA